MKKHPVCFLFVVLLPRKSGTGLGLYNCRTIIESHMGSFEIRSDGPGLGATSTIKFAIQ